MTRRIIYDVTTDKFVDTDRLGLSSEMSFSRLAAILHHAECQPSERLTTIIVDLDRKAIALRFIEGERT